MTLEQLFYFLRLCSFSVSYFFSCIKQIPKKRLPVSVEVVKLFSCHYFCYSCATSLCLAQADTHQPPPITHPQCYIIVQCLRLMTIWTLCTYSILRLKFFTLLIVLHANVTSLCDCDL